MKFLQQLFGKSLKENDEFESFWQWFSENNQHFFQVVKQGGDIEKDFFDPLSRKLNKIRDGYYFLAGMLNDETVELVFTAEGVVRNFVFVEDLVAKAPTLKGWQFTAHKQAAGGSIRFEDYIFDETTIYFFDRTDPDYPDEISIGIVHKQLDSTNNEKILNGVYIYLDNLLGDLRFAEIIDDLELFQEDAVAEPLLSMDKLDSFLVWRQKEFVERYHSVSYDPKNDQFALLESEGENEKLFAVVNKGVLAWEGRMSHPWMGRLTFHYDGSRNNGLPMDGDFEQLTKIDDEIQQQLNLENGHLYIGRQTCNNQRELYYAGRDFREISRVFDKVSKAYSRQYALEYIVFKDKYWRTMARYQA